MKISFESSASAAADACVVFASEGGKLTAAGAALDKKSGGAIKRAISAEAFKGKRALLLAIPGVSGVSAPRVIVAGLGESSKPSDFESVGTALLGDLNRRRAASVRILFDGDAEDAASVAAGMLLSSYRFDRHLTREPKEKKPSLKSVTFAVGKNAAAARKAFDGARKLADGVFLTRDLVSESPNILYPESFANIIKRELAPLGIKVKVLGRKEIKKLGMGALAAVGMGSVREEKLVTMEYKGAAASKKNIAFVGKGVTFDTGGISLKPGPGMEDMKWDMAGAGAVVGLMKVLAARRAKANVVGVVALAENMPAGNACRPSDIVKTMSGQTVEINNTDAEGRLILCDALWYTQVKFKPTQIVDMATLTGAVIIALGHEYGGLFANDDKLSKDLIAAGKATGEALWPLPFHDAWDKAIDSPAADMKNISGSRDAGSAIGAHFLKRFIQKDVKWAHLDIAGMAWSGRDRTSIPKGASAFGVRLLDTYVSEYCE